MIDKLPEHIAEEGRGHPFVEALVRDLRKRHASHAKTLEALSASAAPGAAGMGGRAAELRFVIDMITGAKGAEE